MTSYVSTRGSETASLREAVLQGMSPRGGLYVPTQIPTFDWPPPEGSVAEWLAPSLFPSLEPDVARRIAQDACDFPFPLVQIDIPSHVIQHIEYMLFGGLIILFLIVEPAGLARLWQIVKEKLRQWPFPY